MVLPLVFSLLLFVSLAAASLLLPSRSSPTALPRSVGAARAVPVCHWPPHTRALRCSIQPLAVLNCLVPQALCTCSLLPGILFPCSLPLISQVVDQMSPSPALRDCVCLQCPPVFCWHSCGTPNPKDQLRGRGSTCPPFTPLYA